MVLVFDVNWGGRDRSSRVGERENDGWFREFRPAAARGRPRRAISPIR